MSLIAKEGTSLPPIPEDVYQGICYAIYDIGTQFSEKFGKTSHQCIIIWEIPSVRIEMEKDGAKIDLPRVVSKKYSVSLGEKSHLRRDLQSWRGKAFSADDLAGFDISRLAGANCMIQIVHKTESGKTYSNIASILPLYKGIPPKKPENPVIVYEVPNPIPEGAPKWIAELISQCAEFKNEAVPEEFEDVPF